MIEAIAEEADIAKSVAERALNAFTSTVSKSLAKKDSVVLIGFGTFSLKERSARTGRNPKTGEPIEISAAKVPHFKPGKGLKDAMN